MYYPIIWIFDGSGYVPVREVISNTEVIAGLAYHGEHEDIKITAHPGRGSRPGGREMALTPEGEFVFFVHDNLWSWVQFISWNAVNMKITVIREGIPDRIVLSNALNTRDNPDI